MKYNPLRWLWGLLPIAALAFLAVQWEHGTLEADLGSRAEQRLQAEGLRWAKVGFSARDGFLTGHAPDEAEQTKAVDIVERVRGVRLAENRTELAERIESYSWSALRSGTAIRLRGMVPNEATRQAIVGLARTNFSGSQVDDEMRLTRGSPSRETWMTGVSFALRQLQSLKTGSVRLDNLKLAVAGEAESAAAYRAVKAALAGDVPRGVQLGEDRITPPVVRPYTWSARHSGGQIVLGGHVPTERARGEIVQTVRSSYSRIRVIDTMEAAEGAPAHFEATTVESLKLLARLEDGQIELRDSALTVSGLAADDLTAEAVRRGLRAALPQGVRMAETIRTRESGTRLARPFTTSVQIEGDRLIVSGFAPTEAARDTLLQSAQQRFSGKRIDNRIEVANGAMEGWHRCVDAGLLALSRLGSGRIGIADRRMELTATTGDEELADALPLSLRSAVGGECETSAQITFRAEPEPNLDWRATSSGREVVLQGEVAGGAARAELVQIAQRVFRNANVVDRMRIVEVRSRKWTRTAENGLRVLAELERGDAHLLRQDLNVTGVARDNPTIIGIREQIAREAQSGYTTREQITLAAVAPVPAPNAAPELVDPVARACQDSLRTATREGIIGFERADATLSRDSYATLDKVAAVARTCPKARVEIEGHTDSEGAPDRNQRLSDRRAQAVVDYLVGAGVTPARLKAIGYGETRPLAPNDSDQNRARNRRIEFTVRE